MFDRYIGIDYSGAETPTSSLPGLRVYLATTDSPAVEIPPPTSLRRYWTRRGIAEWLLEELRKGPRTVVGIDHAFSFPLEYFKKHRLAHDWPAFLDDFHHHWPTDEDHTYVDFIRDGVLGSGAARQGSAKWRRITEIKTGSAKAVFHFDVQGSVAKSTHSGLPWLRFLRERLHDKVHFWPFDGWEVPPDKSAIVEVYPRLWSQAFPRDDRTQDQHDAYVIAEWMRESDHRIELSRCFVPPLADSVREVARIEGWILSSERCENTRRSASSEGMLRRRRPTKILVPTVSPEDWRAFLADPAGQWKPSFSAYELAHRWEDHDDFPPEVRRLLENHSAFDGIELLLAIPELKVPLKGGAAASQNDLWALARTDRDLISIAVEGKVEESFANTIGDWLSRETGGRAERWRFLCDTLGLPSDCDRGIRYQLVHRAATAVLQAQRFHASTAVLVVHSFSASRRWFDDFASFVKVLGGSVSQPGTLVALELRGGVEFFTGWASGVEGA